MQKLIASIWILLVCVSPVFVVAQEAAETETDAASEVSEDVDEQEESSFAESIEIENGWLHYGEGGSENGVLLESWHNTNGDEEIDTWFVYEDDVVVRESYDTTGDGEPDLVLAVNANGEITELSGESAVQFERQETAVFTPEQIDIDFSGGEDLVGDLSDISIKEEDNSWIFFVLLFLVGGALYVFWQRQK